MSQNYYGIILQKYGKWGITKKERMFILSQEGLSYYPIPEDEEFQQTFNKLKTDIHNTDLKNIQELIPKANLNNEMKDKFPKSKKKGEISWKNLEETMEDGNIIFFDSTIEKEQ